VATFNSLCEILGRGGFGVYKRQLCFQFSVWDSGGRDVFNEVGEEYFQFSVWDSPPCLWLGLLGRLHALSILCVRFSQDHTEGSKQSETFNSLCEILNYAGLNDAHLFLTFNSLCEIPMILVVERITRLLWLLSILCVRFHSLCSMHWGWAETTFNSLCEIPLIECILRFLSNLELSILCVRFRPPFLAHFIGLMGDLSLSLTSCAATPQLAPEYIKG